MLALFCLRLALGLLAALLTLAGVAGPVNPRFYRVHFLTALGLAACALGLLWGDAPGSLRAALLAAAALAALGSMAWSVEGAPGGRVLIVLTVVALGLALWLTGRGAGFQPASSEKQVANLPHAELWRLADDLASAALLGLATTAMLMGHSYLIAPSMSLRPLKRLLLGLFAALALRAALAGVGLASWTAGHSLANLTDVTVLWLPLRWGLGLVLPAVLGALAWRTLLVPNTQSATGILYIVVVFCFLGELTGQLLLGATGYFL
jgi:hypothetical protein